MSTVQVKGLKEVNDVLIKLPKKLANRSLRKGLMKASRVIVDEAKRNVPKQTGNLADSIMTVGGKSTDPELKNVVVIGLRLTSKADMRKLAAKKITSAQITDGFYGKFVEFGHFAGKRFSYSRKLTSREQHEGIIYKRAAKHGMPRVDSERRRVGAHNFVPAKPFMRPALESKWQESVTVFAQVMTGEIDRSVKELAR
ncbi:MAG: HK97 gp10 family phage protein [Candidatus Obscuribacterales bacterium]|nr:HK97 gp10 family phage protein [Candidatus Obscuribacterales bacterium]